MDAMDRERMNHAFETTPTNQSYGWVNPDSGVRYNVRPTRTYYQGDAPCRTYVTTAWIDGRAETVQGQACRNADGTWHIVA